MNNSSPHIKGIGHGLFTVVEMRVRPTAEAQYKLPTPHTSALQYGFLALLDFVSRATVMAQASVVRPSVRRPSVNSSFSETAAWIQTKFYGQLPIHHISRPFFFVFCFFKIFNFQIFAFLIFYDFFFVFINMGLYGRKNFKRHLLWKCTTDLLPKFMRTARKGLYQSCIKELWNFKFWIFGNFFCSFLGCLTWESMGYYKMCDILETAGRRAKRTKI